jgi:hypothetical protein
MIHQTWFVVAEDVITNFHNNAQMQNVNVALLKIMLRVVTQKMQQKFSQAVRSRTSLIYIIILIFSIDVRAPGILRLPNNSHTHINKTTNTKVLTSKPYTTICVDTS